MKNRANNVHLNIYTLFAWAGLIFLLFIYLYSPQAEVPYKSVFLLIFIFICLMGMLAAVYPSKCLKIFRVETVKEYKCKDKSLKNRGHHPDCGMFKEHVFTFMDKICCVGCTGLLIGALMAIFTVIIYWFYGAFEIFFYIGWLVVGFSLLQMIFLKFNNRLFKFLSNLGLVWGSALILVGLLDYSNPLVCVYFLVYIVLLIWARTAVSQDNHELICANCEV